MRREDRSSIVVSSSRRPRRVKVLIVGRCTASAIASASRKSFLLEEIATMAYLYVAGLSRRCKEEFMPTVAVVSVLFAVLLLSVEAAYAAPWCAQYSGGGGGTNCGFYSFQQCMAAVSGNGGFCTQNQFENPYWGGRARSRQR